MVLSLAAAAGATVWGQTGSEHKAAQIAEQGASRVLVAGQDGLGQPLAEFEPTVVFDPLGDGFVALAIEALVPRGRLISFGVSAGAEVTLNMQLLYRKMISVLGYGGMQLRPEERRAGLRDFPAGRRTSKLPADMNASWSRARGRGRPSQTSLPRSACR